jgi:hypothetical protein
VACSAFFLVNTLPVATIISLAEGAGWMSTWSSIIELSFPFYLACTGLMSIVSAVSRPAGWQMPLAVLPVMLVMYRSFRVYFQRSVEPTTASPTEGPKVMAAAAH